MPHLEPVITSVMKRMESAEPSRRWVEHAVSPGERGCDTVRLSAGWQHPVDRFLVARVPKSQPQVERSGGMWSSIGLEQVLWPDPGERGVWSPTTLMFYGPSTEYCRASS
jgi:hypothetical protein